MPRRDGPRNATSDLPSPALPPASLLRRRERRQRRGRPIAVARLDAAHDAVRVEGNGGRADTTGRSRQRLDRIVPLGHRISAIRRLHPVGRQHDAAGAGNGVREQPIVLRIGRRRIEHDVEAILRAPPATRASIRAACSRLGHGHGRCSSANEGSSMATMMMSAGGEGSAVAARTKRPSSAQSSRWIASESARATPRQTAGQEHHQPARPARSAERRGAGGGTHPSESPAQRRVDAAVGQDVVHGQAFDDRGEPAIEEVGGAE